MRTTDTQHRTDHYRPRDRNRAEALPQRIRAAYKAAGLPTPVPPRVYVDAALDGLPTADVVGRELASEALTQDEKSASKWAAEAAERLAQAEAADRLRASLAKWNPAAVRDHSADMLAQARADLAEPFEGIVKTLTAAARKLPADPFDLEAIMATDATRAHREAGEALVALAALAGLTRSRQSSGVGHRTEQVLCVVTVPDVSVELVDVRSRRPLDPADPDREHREAVRALTRDVEQRGADVALVEVARGTYGDAVRLALPDAADPHAERLRRVATAYATTTEAPSRQRAKVRAAV